VNLANRISRIAIASLFLSLFIGAPATIQTVNAAGPITKTINVKDRNGVALANAQVAIGYPADGQSFETWTWSTPVLTNSSGQAVISNLPQFTDAYVELYVQPQLSDIDNALGFKDSFNSPEVALNSSSTINFDLKASTFKLDIKTSTGSALPVHSWIGYPEDSNMNSDTRWIYTNILRTGNFGIYVDTTTAWQNNGKLLLQFGYQTEEQSDQVDQTSYQLQWDSSHVVSMKRGGFTSDSASQIDNIWQLSSLQSNLKFQIVSPNDNTQQVRKSGLEACKIENDQIAVCEGSGRNLALPNGTYKLRTQPGMSQYASTLFSATVSGGQVTSLKYGFPATSQDVLVANGIAKFPVAIPNLSGFITNPNNETITVTGNQGFSIQLLKDDGNGNYPAIDEIWSNDGSYAFSISQTGKYRLNVEPQELPDFVSVQTPDITVTNSGGIKLSWNGTSAVSSLVKNIPLAAPNLSGLITKPNGDTVTLTGDQGFSVQLMKDSGNGDFRYVQGTWSRGNYGFNLSQAGRYRIEVQPQDLPDFATTLSPIITVTTNGGLRLSWNGGTAATSVIENIQLSVPNLSGLITKPNGEAMSLSGNQGFSVQLLKDDGYGNFQYVQGSWSRGNYGFNISQVGSYRVEVQPQDLPDYATTRSPVITVTNSGGIKLSWNGATAATSVAHNIALATPSLRIRVREVGAATNLRFAGIEIRKDDRFYTWVNTLNSGIAAISLDSVGNYQFIVNPNENTPNSTRKVYEVVATSGENGSINVSISGVSPDANGLSTLYLGTAQIRGKILPPGNETTGVANSWVVAVDKVTKNEMWQYGANSSSDGSFAMSLPAGTYTLYARAPWGVANVGDSEPIGDITIDSSGNVTITGAAQAASLTSSNFTIRLQAPYWSGKVLAPTGNDGIANARVCLNSIVSGNQFWSCANTNSQGQWAMGKPTGFTDFGSNDQLQIAENQNAQYSMATYQGKNAIEAAGFLHAGGSVDLRLNAPNFTIRALYGSDSPASNIWVNLNANLGGWLGGSSTDANGFAKFYVADLTKGVQVQLDPANNSVVAAVAATTFKKYLDNEMSSHVTSSNFSDTITLSAPNIRGIVSDAGNVAPNSWVELFDASTNEWKGGSNTNRDGYFALNAGNGTFTVRVNPPWNSSTTATSHSYEVVVSGGNVSTFKDKVNNGNVSTVTYGSGAAYPLTLGVPSVIGKVTDPNNQAVQNSWVTPTNSANGSQLWQIGTNSRADGSFSMAVPDGNYSIGANAPWNSSNYSASAGCSVTITNGNITTTAGGCIQVNKQLNLQLRSPNLRVQVKDANGTALQNAHVGLGLGSWNVNAQTDSNGYASLFVDPAAINSSNNGKISGVQNLWMWIDPPYGNSDSVRVQCSSLQANSPCSNLPTVTPGNTTFTNTEFVATLPAPNTSLFVKLPNGSSAGSNAWVTLERIYKNNAQQETGRQWIAGSNTDSNGKATFNIVETNVAYAVRIEAPWNQKDLFAGATYETGTGVIGLTWNQVNGQDFRLSSPNLTLSVKISDGSQAMSNGWIGVQKVNSSDVPQKWIAGYGLDQNGKVSIKLDSNDRFKVTIYPGMGITGVATDCIVTTNGSGVVSLVNGKCGTAILSNAIVTLPIATGNVTGVVTGPNSQIVAGAIVKASIHGTNPQDSDFIVTSTDKNGVYNLQLDGTSNQHWDITVIPVNTSSDSVRLRSKTETDKTIANSGQTTVNVLLELAN
jgi:hypothetical protein